MNVSPTGLVVLVAADTQELPGGRTPPSACSGVSLHQPKLQLELCEAGCPKENSHSELPKKQSPAVRKYCWFN